MSVLSLSIHPADDPNGSALCTLTDGDISAFEMRVAENELGGGKFTIRRDHTLATAANMAAGNYVKVTIPSISGSPVFAFWLDEHDDTILSRTEEGGEYLTRGGPGPLAILRRAVLLDEFYNDPLGGEARGNYDVAGYWTWSSEPYGAILVRLIEEGQYEPGTPLADVTIDFTRTLDSNGDAWPDIEELIQVGIGTDGLSLYERLVASGFLFVRADPDLAVHGYGVPPGVDRSSGSFGSGKVRFLKGTNIETELVRQAKGVEAATHAIVIGKDHVYRKVVSPSYTSGAARWVTVDYNDSNDPDLLDKVGLEDLRRRELMQDTVEMEILTGDDESTGLYQPFEHFNPGDLVTLHTGSDPWDYNEYEARLSGFRIVLGQAARDGTTLEAMRSLRVIVELNGSHTTGFTGQQDGKGGCCPPGFPYVPVSGSGDCAPAAFNETAPAGASPGGHGHWMSAARPVCTDLAMRVTGTFHVEPTPGGFYTESSELLLIPEDVWDGGFDYFAGAPDGEVLLAPVGTFGGGTTATFDKVTTYDTANDTWQWSNWDDLGGDIVLAAFDHPQSPVEATEYRVWRNGQWSPAVEADYQVRWYDPGSGDLEGTGNQPSYGQVVYEQVVYSGSGPVVTNHPYAQNSITVSAGGVVIVVDQTDPDAGEFDPPSLPAGTVLTITYQATSGGSTGAGNTESPTTGGWVPYPLLGTGGDGSGDNVLHDDGTWGPATSIAALDDLTDVVLASPSAGQRLRFDGTNWVNVFTRDEPHVDYTGSVVLDGSGNPVMVEVLI